MLAPAIIGLDTMRVVMCHARVWTRVAVTALALVTIAGCANVRIPVPAFMGGTSSHGYTGADLSEDLAFFADRYGAAIIGAADRIALRSTDREIRKATVLWKLRLLPMMHELAFLDDPQRAFASVLTLTLATRRYVETGEGASLFGAHQGIAVDVSRQLEEDILSIGHNFIAPKKLDQIVTQMDELARTGRIHASDFNTQRVQRAVASLGAQGALGAVLNAPLAPFRVLEGVSSGAAAIREFNRTAEEFAQIVSYLPRQLRWETQLLLYDIEERDTVVQTLAAVDSAAASAERVAAAADRLPDDMRLVLEETTPAFAAANEVLSTVRELLDPLRATAEQLRLASTSWEEIIGAAGAPGRDARPFDVREWEQTFAEHATAATELRNLTSALQTTLDTEHLGNALRGITLTIDDAEARARAVVDLAAWRALQLLVVLFVLLGVYRLIARRTGH